MCPIFNCWAHCDQMVPVTTMCSPCACWVFAPLSPVRGTDDETRGELQKADSYSESLETGLYLRTGARNATGNKGIPGPKHCNEENMWNQPPRTEGRKETEPQRIKEEKSSGTNYYQVRTTEQVDAIICDRTENGTELIRTEKGNGGRKRWIELERVNTKHRTLGCDLMMTGTSVWAWLGAAVRSDSESKVGNVGNRHRVHRRVF